MIHSIKIANYTINCLIDCFNDQSLNFSHKFSIDQHYYYYYAFRMRHIIYLKSSIINCIILQNLALEVIAMSIYGYIKCKGKKRSHVKSLSERVFASEMHRKEKKDID